MTQHLNNHWYLLIVGILLYFSQFSRSACVIQDDLKAFRDDLPSMSDSEIDAALVELDKTLLPQIAKELSVLLSTRQATLQWRILRVLEMASLSEVESSSELAAAAFPFLNDASHATRSMAMNILVNLGGASVPLLENGLKSESGRVRSGCIAALNRIDRLTEHATMELCQDSDPRVRYQAVLALKQNESSVQTLVKAATDEEPSIAWLAISRLGKYPELHELIVPHLIPLLHRKEVASQAAISLARFGADSAAAIPALIRASPLGQIEGYYLSIDAADLVISRIGKPRIEDLDHFISMLDLKDSHQRALTSVCIGKLGLSGKKASNSLTVLIEREIELKKLQMADRKRLGRDFAEDDKNDYSESTSAALYAYWNVAEDLDGFRRLATLATDIGSFDSLDEFWSLADDGTFHQLLRVLFESQHKSLINQGLQIVYNSEREMYYLYDYLRSLKEQGDLIDDIPLFWTAFSKTVPVGTANWEEQVRNLYARGKILKDLFCSICRDHGFKQPETLQIMKDSFLSANVFESQQVLDVYLSLQDDPIRCLLDLHKEGEIDPRLPLNWILENSNSSPLVFEMVRSGFRSASEDVRSESLRLIGRFKDLLVGKTVIVERLQSEFEKRWATRIDKQQTPTKFDDALAIAIYSLSGDPGCIIRLLDLYENSNQDPNAVYANETEAITSLLVACENWNDRFDPYVIRGLESQHPHFAKYLSEDMFYLPLWIEVGMKSKNEKVVAVINSLENCKDDVVSKATKRARMALSGKKQ